MKKIEELGISPTPWTARHNGRAGISYVVSDANDVSIGIGCKPDAIMMTAAPKLYAALYDAWERACISPSRECKLCPYRGMYCNSWRDALAEAAGEREVVK